MFGNKKDGFKYENEVKALIQEATNGLNQRILTLETQNQQLIQELYQLRNGICQEFQRLEQRITDFTDVWHPMMTQNINRIKEDLEKTIAETEREDIKKVHEDLETKMVSMIDNNKENTALKKILRISEHMGCCIKLSDIKKQFDAMYVNWEADNKTKYNPEIHDRALFHFDIHPVYDCRINIIDDNNCVIINGSNRKTNHPADMLLENGWKMFLREMPYVVLTFCSKHCFSPSLFQVNANIYQQDFNEYVFSPNHTIQSARKAIPNGWHTPFV
jgi:hypothetical protein